MKKLSALLMVILLIFTMVGCATSNDVEGLTYDYLETKGYTKDDIKEIEIDRSVVNKVLGYNEWRIFVEFKSEPDIIFAFTYRDDEIIRQGIKSNVRQLDKDEIQAYDEKFDNGELKKQSRKHKKEDRHEQMHIYSGRLPLAGSQTVTRLSSPLQCRYRRDL